MGYKWDMFCDKRVMTGIEITFKFKSESNDTIFTSSDVISRKPKLIITGFQEKYDRILQIEKDNRKIFNDVAKKMLVDNRKQKIIRLESGASISGKHIVKCIWFIQLVYKKPSKEEWEKLKKTEKQDNEESEDIKIKEKKKDGKGK